MGWDVIRSHPKQNLTVYLNGYKYLFLLSSLKSRHTCVLPIPNKILHSVFEWLEIHINFLLSSIKFRNTS